jgi:alanine dehydrogenase
VLHGGVPGVRPAKVVVLGAGVAGTNAAVDQSGCFEDTHPTTHQEPTYKVHDSIFYCVANMLGAVPNTSTYALTNVTLRYAVALANHGVKGAFDRFPAVAGALNVAAGKVTHKSVSDAHGHDLADWQDLVTV